MATRPSTLPRWADTVTADATRVVEPTSGKKDVGFETEEIPPAQTANWLWNLIYQWIVFLQTWYTEEEEVTLGPAAPFVTDWDPPTAGTDSHYRTTADGAHHGVALPVPVGRRLKAIKVRCKAVGGGVGNVSLTLLKNDVGESTSGDVYSTGSTGLMTATVDTPAAAAAGDRYHIWLSSGIAGGGGTREIYSVAIVLDRA